MRYYRIKRLWNVLLKIILFIMIRIMQNNRSLHHLLSNENETIFYKTIISMIFQILIFNSELIWTAPLDNYRFAIRFRVIYSHWHYVNNQFTYCRINSSNWFRNLYLSLYNIYEFEIFLMHNDTFEIWSNSKPVL